MSEERGLRKQREGVVVSNKMQKTIVVVVERKVQHAKYRKFVRSRKSYKVHDEENTLNEGLNDSVLRYLDGLCVAAPSI